MQGERFVDIDAPRNVIFDYVGDFEKHVEWCHQPTKMTKLTEGPIAVGTRYRTDEQPPSNANWVVLYIMFPIANFILGAKGYTEAEITDFTSNQRIGWRSVAPGRSGNVMQAEWEIVLEEHDTGTRVIQRFKFTPLHPITKRMVSDSTATDVAIEVSRNLEKLKSIVQS